MLSNQVDNGKRYIDGIKDLETQGQNEMNSRRRHLDAINQKERLDAPQSGRSPWPDKQLPLGNLPEAYLPAHDRQRLEGLRKAHREFLAGRVSELFLLRLVILRLTLPLCSPFSRGEPWLPKTSRRSRKVSRTFPATTAWVGRARDQLPISQWQRNGVPT